MFTSPRCCPFLSVGHSPCGFWFPTLPCRDCFIGLRVFCPGLPSYPCSGRSRPWVSCQSLLGLLPFLCFIFRTPVLFFLGLMLPLSTLPRTSVLFLFGLTLFLSILSRTSVLPGVRTVHVPVCVFACLLACPEPDFSMLSHAHVPGIPDSCPAFAFRESIHSPA